MDVITYLFHPQEKGHYLRREGGGGGEQQEWEQREKKNGEELEHATKPQWVGDEFPVTKKHLCAHFPPYLLIFFWACKLKITLNSACWQLGSFDS